VPLDQLVLMPEVDARRALTGHAVMLRILAPVGQYAGRGTLRVLRARPVTPQGRQDEVVELVCGYESYQRLSG
jgi:hypothetical protein